MLNVSVRGADKAPHKFESRMPPSWGLGGEVLAVGQEGKEVEWGRRLLEGDKA